MPFCEGVESEFCVHVCVLADSSLSQTMKIPPQQVNLLHPHQQILYISWIDSFLQWRGIRGHCFFLPLQLYTVYHLEFELNMNATKLLQRGKVKSVQLTVLV